jgi:hypothetical protein
MEYLGTEGLIVLQEYKKSNSTRIPKSCFTEDILISDANKTWQLIKTVKLLLILKSK